MPQTVASGMLAIHEYSGRMYKECLSAMSLEFRSEEMVSRTDVPTYQSWYDTADLRPAYRTYRKVLQILQRRMPTRRWVLKSPAHLQGLPALMEVFDDARFVITHRDPHCHSALGHQPHRHHALGPLRRGGFRRHRPLPPRSVRPQPRQTSST